ncbi:diacylglycerol/lipid kinase family protein [Gaoshiqia sediminis]|uniref:Diacylglycerol kinase family lipid kinase n=1 Tax=Gaoshiqia sediminis TaxID=2986998 RepID=A0AA42C8H5_9BACT|nr:diacylglycerol kinase family protein [Gaoshiqia sediminis]MCW0481217.1 diacylglycerol kinase family lipid kinase [Gaoshiqia sediminis]
MTKPSRPRILFIVNPNAGKRNARHLHHRLKPYNAEIDIRFSEHPGHASRVVREELDNYEIFVAAGGDGTVNEVASSLAGTDKKLAVYPSGSGNGFAREFGFEKNINQLMTSIRRDQTIKTDVIRINGRTCMHIAGTGFDSAVTAEFETLKRHGFLNYALSILKVVLNYRPIEAIIQLENETISGQFFMINIANTGQFGYNIRIAPAAHPADGRFDLVLVSAFPRWYFPIFALQLLAGKLQTSSFVRYISCTSEITLSTPFTSFQIEGEPIQVESPVKISIEPGRLNVIDTGQTRF